MADISIHRHREGYHLHVEGDRVRERERRRVPRHDPDRPQDVLEIAPAKVKGPKQTRVLTLLETLMESRITVGAYTDAVEIPKAKAKQKLYDNDQVASFTNNKLNQGKLDAALTLGAILTELNQIITEEQALVSTQNSQISGLNSTVTAYNSQITGADDSAIDTLNDGTALYNNGDITEAQYINDYVNPYNAYVASRNPTIQGTITSYSSTVNQLNTVDIPANNASIAEQNTRRQAFGIPDIPAQSNVASQSTSTLPTVTLPLGSPPEPLLSDPRTPLVQTPPVPDPPDATGFISTYFMPIFDAATKAIEINDKPREMLVAQQDYDRFFLRGVDPKKIMIVDSNAPRRDRVSHRSFTGGGNVSGAVKSSDKGTPHLEADFSNSIFTAYQQQYQLEVGRSLLRNVKTYKTLLLHDAGLHALRPALHALRLEGLTPQQAIEAFRVTSGVSLATAITQLVASGSTERAVRALVEADLKGKADQATIDKTVRVLTAQLNVSLLQTAATSLAIALQAPGLTGQLTANVRGVPDNIAQIPLTPGQVLNDDTRRTFFTTTLAGTLSGDTGISSAAAQTIINNAIDGFLATGTTRNEAQLRTAFINSLINQGIDQNEAERIANQAVTIVQQESQGTRVLHTVLLDQNLDINLLAGQLQQQQNIGASEARTLATQAITRVLQNSSISNDAEFQAALQLQLEAQGITGAASLASNVVKGAVATAPAETSPLINPETPLNSHQLRTSIAEHASGLLSDSLGTEDARRHGHRIAQIVVGAPGSSTSILALLNSNVSIMRREAADHAGGAVIPSFQDFISPSIDAFVFNNRLLNPANTFFLTAMTSTRLNSLPQPKNYVRYLEFYV